jgi:hypothetical protein
LSTCLTRSSSRASRARSSSSRTSSGVSSRARRLDPRKCIEVAPRFVQACSGTDGGRS